MTKGFQDPTRAFAAKQSSGQPALDRFAPADNLYDAIRSDVAGIGGVQFEPLLRQSQREAPFNDIDENPHSE